MFLFRHFLFDFDGTLADSAALHDRAFRATLAESAPRLNRRFDYSAVRGLATRAAFIRLGILDRKLLERCIVRKQEHYRELVRRGRLKAFPYVRSVLKAIADKGRASYLVTSGSPESIELALSSLGLGGFFRGVINSRDAASGKPAADPYLACLRRFGLRASDAIAVEDARAGVLSARGAGLRVIGVHNAGIAKLVDFYYDGLAELSGALRECGRQLSGAWAIEQGQGRGTR